jgi:IPT/TIG domain-containing protein
MKTKAPILLIVLVASLWNPSPAASELLFSQNADGQSTYGPSQLSSASGVNSEIADDFNVIANIDRVYVSGFVWGTVNFQGVYIRFYQYGADNRPGALQREYFLAPGDPNVTFDPLSGAIDAKLSSAFPATGRHFLSVQPVINYWYWWSANINGPSGQAFYFRDNALGEAWHHGDNLNLNVNADVSFYLYGSVTGAGVIDSLSVTTVPRSGFLEIFGNNFGGDGTVFIGGIRAPVADWSSTRVVAYVPESAPLSTVNVKVVTVGGTSNLKPLSVTTRPAAAGHVNWRFRMDGPYSEVRAAIGPDQTVYAIDAFQHLYALAPDGALKWLVRGAGDKGVAVGPDGTIYVASESFINAFNTDGSVKWSFVQNPRAMICLGVSVGPDGNIYSVGTEGPGVFSLTPAGALRWQLPESYARPIVDYGEIVFGPNGSSQQLYFYANNHLRAIRLDGTSVFENSSGQVSQLRPGLQPVVSTDGSVHTVLSAYTPNGIALWSFPTPYPYNVFTPADIGSDGIHYFVQNLSQIFALNPNGSQRWHVTSTAYLGGPIVDSLNTQLVMGSADTLDHAGFILSASAKDGHELWRVTLPAEDPTVFNSALGIFGFNQFVSARARFTSDGQTAYLMTATATGDNNTSRSFVYSLNTSNGVSPTPTPAPTPIATALRSTSINLSATLLKNNQVSVNGIVTVKDASGVAVAGATVAATWTKPSGTAVVQTASSNTSGGSNFSIKGGRGTYTLRVNNITKAGYTFDKTSGVLSKSITQ